MNHEDSSSEIQKQIKQIISILPCIAEDFSISSCGCCTLAIEQKFILFRVVSYPNKNSMFRVHSIKYQNRYLWAEENNIFDAFICMNANEIDSLKFISLVENVGNDS